MSPLQDKTSLYQRSESLESDNSASSFQLDGDKRDSTDSCRERRQIFHDCWTCHDDKSGTYEVFVQNARGIRFRTSVNVQEYVPDILSTDDDTDDDTEAEKLPKWLETQICAEINQKQPHKQVNEVILNAIRKLRSCFITPRSLSSKP